MKPKVIWQNNDYRVVQTGRKKFTSEMKMDNDTLGNEVWLSTGWGSVWVSKFIHYLIQKTEGKGR